MATLEADTVVIGSGIAGTMVARELVRAGRTCTIIERGAFVPWQQQASSLTHQRDIPTSEHNHDNDPEGQDWPWNYLYMVGGTSNHWAGTSPRFLPEDFEMRSRYGVAVDWPIGYDELEPYYSRAERALAVAGAANDLMPGFDPPQPPHPFSPQDELVAPFLDPYIPLSQARPSRPVRGNPACCGSARCQLCPVNARYSVLNGLGDVLRDGRVRLIDETVAARLTRSRDGRRVKSVECIDGAGERSTIEAKRFVVAANGIESPGLLLRSGIDDGDTGRFLADHRNATLKVELDRPSGAGEGASLITGASYRYYSGDFRSRRAAAMLLPFNPGPVYAMAPAVTELLANDQEGSAVRDEVAGRYRRSILFDIYLDDLLDRRSGVRLSSTRDRFGLPRNLVRYMPPSEYQQRTVAFLTEEVPRRLRSLGVRRAEFGYVPIGGHLIGTLRMGTGGGAVVDRDLRHRGIDNLFVSGSSVFPTSSPSHPTLTIAALAIRLGEMLASEPAG